MVIGVEHVKLDLLIFHTKTSKKLPVNILINLMNITTINSLYRHTYPQDTGFIMNNSLYLIARFLNIGTITKKSKWKCKHCNDTIFDDKQIFTQESHFPVYHIKCYMELYNLIKIMLKLHQSKVDNLININEI